MVLVKSGESATSTLSANIDSNLRLILKVMADETSVPCIFDTCIAGFFIWFLLFWVNLMLMLLRLEKKIEKCSVNTLIS